MDPNSQSRITDDGHSWIKGFPPLAGSLSLSHAPAVIRSLLYTGPNSSGHYTIHCLRDQCQCGERIEHLLFGICLMRCIVVTVTMSLSPSPLLIAVELIDTEWKGATGPLVLGMEAKLPSTVPSHQFNASPCIQKTNRNFAPPHIHHNHRQQPTTSSTPWPGLKSI